MNYTENYHLPQWVKEDRIMMDDFNQMCADIDSGLTVASQEARDASKSGGELDKKTMDRLCRLAYNHYSVVQDMAPFPWQVGVFHQNPALDNSNVTGTILWEGVCFAGKGPVGQPGILSGDFSQYGKALTPLKVVKGNLAASSPLTASFCIQGSGYFERFILQGNLRNNVVNTPAPARITLTNQDTGEIELIQDVDLRQNIAAGALVNYFVEVHVPFQAGQHYLMKLEPLAAVYDLDVSFAMSELSPIRIVHNNQSITATHTMREREGSSGGLLILRGLAGGSTGKLTVTWDGKEVPLYNSRMVQLSDGRQVREMAYRRDEPVPATTTVSLRFDVGECGYFLFYDWGAILL